MNYDGVERLRNITFPTPESSRDINLSCPIGPGALSERYRVKWVSRTPGVDGFIFLQNKYNITVSHASSARDQYECQVTITHRIGQGVNEITRRYDGPMIVIKNYGESTDTEKCIVRVQQCGYYVYIYVFVTQLGIFIILIFSCVAVLATVENDVQNVSIIEGDYVSNEVRA